MAHKETNILQEIRLACAPVAVLFRNNIGKFQDLTGRWVSYGLCNPGGSDLIGWRRCDGKFVALEVKIPGKKATPAQNNFIFTVQEAGGIGGVVTSPEEALYLLSTGP